jgi:hypothetical protein
MMESFLVSKLLIHRIKNRRGIIRTSDNFQKLFFPILGKKKIFRKNRRRTLRKGGHATVSTPQQGELLV